MDAVMARATVRRGARRVDVSAPVGTPITELLSSLRIDRFTDRIELALPDGTVLTPDATLGSEVPDGSVIAVNDEPTASERRAQEERARAARGTPLGLLAVLGLLVLGLDAAVLAVPLARHQSLSPAWVRWVVVGLGALVAAAESRSRLARRPGGAAVVPLLWALPAVGAVVPEATGALRMSLVCFMCAGFVAAFVGWLLGRHVGWAAAAIVWATAGSVLVAAVSVPLPTVSLAVLALVGSVLALMVTPGAALQVPESQLVDLPELMTLAPTAHGVPAPRPARITGRRVRRSLEDATHVVTVVTLLAALVAVLATPFVATGVGGDVAGRACAVVIASAALLLVSHPRASRMAVVRWANRIAAAVMTAAAVFVVLWHRPDAATGLVAALVLVGLACVLLALVTTRDPKPVGLARLADIAHSLAVAVLFVSAVLASGLWHLMVQWGA